MEQRTYEVLNFALRKESQGLRAKRTRMVNHLVEDMTDDRDGKFFCDIRDITVSDMKGTIKIMNRFDHVPTVKLKWAHDHYIVSIYIGRARKAIMSLANLKEMRKFIDWYEIMADHRCRQ